MLTKLKITDPGRPVRKLIPKHNASKRIAYRKAGEEFHRKYALRRFTYHHGREAGYRPRSGDKLPYGSKEYWRSYVGRKKSQKGHRDPMVWSGTTRERARSATIIDRNNRSEIRYRLNVFNFHPWMNAEFTKVLTTEAEALGRVFDRVYKKEFK